MRWAAVYVIQILTDGKWVFSCFLIHYFITQRLCICFLMPQIVKNKNCPHKRFHGTQKLLAPLSGIFHSSHSNIPHVFTYSHRRSGGNQALATFCITLVEWWVVLVKGKETWVTWKSKQHGNRSASIFCLLCWLTKSIKTAWKSTNTTEHRSTNLYGGMPAASTPSQKTAVQMMDWFIITSTFSSWDSVTVIIM